MGFMIQSTLHPSAPAGLHVAIIMDGNGRWATAQGRPRAVGHRVGTRAVRRIVEAAPELGIGTLTLFAFSSDNWQRPAREVASLMRLFNAYLRAEVETCIQRGIRLSIIGQRDRLPLPLRVVVLAAEAATAGGHLLHLRIAVDYSARQSIMRAACRWSTGAEPSCETFARLLGEVDHTGAPVPDVDLLIRTGGEQRLSDFLLWECAYAELFFTRKMWPDFTPADLEAAVHEFRTRERRFGRVPDTVPV
jgi:undecaprenyl diphosphate synthase